MLGLGCDDASGHVLVPLAGPISLSATPTRFTPATPLSAAEDENGVCVLPPEGYDLHPEWTLGPPDQPGVRVRGAAVLTNGDTVALHALVVGGALFGCGGARALGGSSA